MSFKIVKVILIGFILILFIAVGFGFFLRTRYINPVLMYHYILNTEDAKKDRRIVTPKTFEKQMRFLKVNNYNVIALEKLGQLLKEKTSIPRKTVVITFDDGYLDNYENAFPILKRYGLVATMFIITDNIGTSDWLTRDQIKEMSDSGLITIGSHTLSHVHLPSVTDINQLRREIYDSKKKLEAIINKPVNCFSYPVGGFNEEIKDMVKDAGYLFAVTTSPGLFYSNNDPFAIKRIRIDERAKDLFIFWFESSGLYKYFLEVRKEHDLKRKKNKQYNYD